jgi:ribosomal protein S18 acetylase RimI-like enzyme
MSMIKQIDQAEFPKAVELIRASFATVAKEFGLTEENCPRYVAFSTIVESLQKHLDWGWLMYGFYEGAKFAGYVSISKEYGTGRNVYELHNVAVLPGFRHKGYGSRLLDFCKTKVKELGGSKISISIIEENTVLKNWYAAHGFVHTGTKKFEFFPFVCGYMELEV